MKIMGKKLRRDNENLRRASNYLKCIQIPIDFLTNEMEKEKQI